MLVGEMSVFFTEAVVANDHSKVVGSLTRQKNSAPNKRFLFIAHDGGRSLPRCPIVYHAI